MDSKPLVGVYEGKGVIRLREQPQQLEEDQEILISIVPFHPEAEDEGGSRPSPLTYFRQLVKKLCEYERAYGMTSQEFYQQFQAGAIPEGPCDYLDWRVLYDSYQHMQQRFGFSRDQLADT
jgi:hypothetical protein